MKSILYVGATLMIGASIYGFVDYKKTSHNKEFTNMYEEEKKKAPVVIADNETTEPVVKKEIAGNDKKAITKKQVVSPQDAAHNDETIATIKPIAANEKIVTKEAKEIEKSSVEVTPSKNSGVEKKVKKKKKLNHRIFSRAPLRDEEKIHLVEPLKTDVKKIEKKEQ